MFFCLSKIRLSRTYENVLQWEKSMFYTVREISHYTSPERYVITRTSKHELFLCSHEVFYSVVLCEGLRILKKISGIFQCLLFLGEKRDTVSFRYFWLVLILKVCKSRSILFGQYITNSLS